MSGDSRATAWLAFGAAILILVSPLKLGWARAELGWIAPFALWSAFIALGAWLSRPGRGGNGDGDGDSDGDSGRGGGGGGAGDGV